MPAICGYLAIDEKSVQTLPAANDMLACSMFPTTASELVKAGVSSSVSTLMAWPEWGTPLVMCYKDAIEVLSPSSLCTDGSTSRTMLATLLLIALLI